MGYDINTGKELWVSDRAAQNPGAHAYPHFSAFGEGLYAQFDSAQMNWVAYDLQTGIQKWRSDTQDYPWGAYMGNSLGGLIVNGKLYSMGYDGMVHAFDANTGKHLWKFYSGNSGTETPYGSYPLYGGPIIADNVLFANNGEHSPTIPLYKGQKLFAIDATNGNSIWNITGMLVLQAIADGYLLAINEYDNQIYCFGKGPSATTIEAPQIASQLGSPILIQGTVTDQSTAQKGTLAISDIDMSAWMEYLNMQKAKPTTANGVPVHLTAIDPNGNFQDIGTVTSDSYGKYAFSWNPPVTGLYKVTAEFKGSESYGSSSAETSFIVAQPAATASPAKAVNQVPAEAFYAVAFVVILLIAVLVVLMLRKK